MSFYDDLQAIAMDVLAEFNQGGLSKITITSTPAANEWELPSNSATPVTINAVVKGVSQKYVDGSRIVATDLEATLPGDVSIDAGSNVTVNGNPVQVIAVMPTPASGTPVIVKVVLRG